jgi:hypothetical protein
MDKKKLNMEKAEPAEVPSVSIPIALFNDIITYLSAHDYREVRNMMLALEQIAQDESNK